MKIWCAATCCFLFLVCQTNAQKLIFKTYTVEDGLVSNPVRCIYQDKKGFIWIGTWEGLSKYDGNKFTNYTTASGLSNGMVNDMYESAGAKLYVAENNGTVDVLQHNIIVKKAAIHNIIINRFHITKNHSVLAATDSSGLYEFNNERLIKFHQRFPALTYNDLIELNDSLLIGGAEGSLWILNKQYDLFAEIKQPKYILTNKIFKDSKNRVWAGTNYGLKILSPPQNNNQPTNYTLAPAFPDIPELNNSIIADMMEDAGGVLWIATSKGLVKINPDGSWRLFSEKDGLSSSNTTCLYQDKEKNIWIGTTLGLTKLVTENNISIYTNGNGYALNACNFLWHLKRDVFITGTETGIQLFNSTKREFLPISPPHNLYYGFVKNSQPLLFCGTCNKFGMYDSVKQYVVDVAFPDTLNASVYCSVMDADGNIFNGTQDGLVVRSGKKSYPDNKIPYRITALHIDKKGYLWVATWNNGLYRVHYSNKKNKSSTNQLALSVQNFSYLLPDTNVRSMYEDSNNNMWIGTRYRGIVQLAYNNRGHYSVRHFDLEQGLMSNWVRVIAEDSEGCFWIGSDLGIDKLVPADSSFRVFNFSRVNNYFDRINAILPGHDHSLWLATSSGLVNIIDGGMEKMPAAPVYITSVSLGDTAFNYNSHDAGSKVQLQYYQNQATFEFSSPSFVNEKQILYSYRLSGSADTAWSKPSSQHNVAYASLRSGDYRFEVRTIGWNSEYGNSANFIFSVKLPFWQTGWFYSFIALFILLFFYAIYLFRIKQLNNLQKVRNHIATDLHDDIGSTLSNINILSALSKKSLENPAQANIFLDRISEEVQTSSQSLDDIIWSVNTQNDNWEETFSRMRRYAAEVFENNGTQYHFNLDAHAGVTKLSMEKRRDIFLIYKEVVNNIHKHAKATTVAIDMRFKEQQLVMVIHDNGIGFNKHAQTHRNGLKNLHRRVAHWKGKIDIDNSRTGTSVKIEI